VAARLSSLARTGEILISEAAYTASGLTGDGLESRHLELKGRSEPMEVLIQRVSDIPSPESERK
jgi:class 3 adenylate cyclase